MAGGTTISNFAKNLGKDIWSIQIEINCGITNKENKKLSVLLDTLKNWIKEI